MTRNGGCEWYQSIRRGRGEGKISWQKICQQLISNNSQNTVQCTRIVSIPVRTRKIGQNNSVLKVYSGGNPPASSSMEKRSHHYLEVSGRDSPAICRPRKGFFHNFDSDTVLPASKTTTVCNLPVSIWFEQRTTRYGVFLAAWVPWFNQVAYWVV